MTLRLVVRGIPHRLRRFASAWCARPLALRFRVGPPLALRLCFRLGLCLQPSHSGLDLDQALLAARQFGRQLVAASAAQGGIVCLVLLGRLCHQGFNLLPQTLHSLLHIPLTHGLMTRRMALDFRPIA